MFGLTLPDFKENILFGAYRSLKKSELELLVPLMCHPTLKCSFESSVPFKEIFSFLLLSLLWLSRALLPALVRLCLLPPHDEHNE